VIVPAGAIVALKNVVINAIGGSDGIVLQSGAEIFLEDCVIANFTSSGIDASAGGSKLHLKNTVIRNNSAPGAVGIKLGTDSIAELDRVRIEGNASDGIRLDAGAAASLKRSSIAQNGGAGVAIAAASAHTTKVTIEDSLVSDNAGDGISASATVAGAIANVGVVRSTITRNDRGVFANAISPGTTTLSVVDNLIVQNGGDGVLVNGAGATILVSSNTFSGNVTHALNTASGGTIHTAQGADGLPNNAGEQATPTAGTVVSVVPF
jgi:hypothetical protein